jgi:hypothetical protein
MRLLCLLCLGTALLGQTARDLPEPGLDRVFLARILPSISEGQGRPWHLYREPSVSASAVVEVVGTLTAEELRQARFAEFLDWFQADLLKFRKEYLDGGADPVETHLPAAGPRPMLVPLGRAAF